VSACRDPGRRGAYGYELCDAFCVMVDMLGVLREYASSEAAVARVPGARAVTGVCSLDHHPPSPGFSHADIIGPPQQPNNHTNHTNHDRHRDPPSHPRLRCCHGRVSRSQRLGRHHCQGGCSNTHCLGHGRQAHRCRTQHAVTNPSTQPAVCWDDRFSGSSPARGGRPSAQA
jgi:hypothetical protein